MVYVRSEKKCTDFFKIHSTDFALLSSGPTLEEAEILEARQRRKNLR